MSHTKSEIHFPPDFRWGTATSSHQVEGYNTNNDWWAAEQAGGTVFENQSSGRACDWWLRAENDFDRMAEMGQNAHRLSIEWSRVQPTPDTWSEAALLRYRDMIEGLHARGIEPMVTLYHFTLPKWIAERGGWENKHSPEWFVAYVRKVVTALGDLVTLWCTINEPMVLVGQGYAVDIWPPGERDLNLALKAALNLARAHAAAYHIIREIIPDAQVGLAKHMVVWKPHRDWLPTDHLITKVFDYVTNHAFLRAVTRGQIWIPGRGTFVIDNGKNTLDWLGINYYQRYRVGAKIFNILRNFFPGIPAEVIYQATRRGNQKGPGPWGEIHARGLYESLGAVEKYGIPLYVTENGLPDEYDHYRPRFILMHLYQLSRAIEQGMPVRGYYHWSLVDNFEWDKGYNPQFRFGLLGVDFETQERIPRKSGQLYTEICQQGGLTCEMIQRYAPLALPVIFPHCDGLT
ncbi:MAG: glycoside hydrolase family 1 protein [Anaerolineae bacterium]|nr:glycoside hydrolase family 1 protein [Anaerolineae bacterium]